MPDGKEIVAPLADNVAELDRFLATVAHSRVSALLLDYDGTLAPFSTDRQRAFPYPNVVPLLQQIMASGRTRLVIITGRSAPQVRFLLGMNPDPEIWGSHGFQRLRPDGTCENPSLDPQVEQALWDAKEWLAQQNLQHLAEVKPGGIAIHWRGLPEARASEVRDRALRGWFPVAQHASMSLLEFDGGVEIRVPDVDKGDAVRTLLGEMDSHVPVAYLGDDATDEPAFEALGTLGTRGLSVLVRPVLRKTSAKFWLKPPDELVDFLLRWRQACCGSEAPSEVERISQ